MGSLQSEESILILHMILLAFFHTLSHSQIEMNINSPIRTSSKCEDYPMRQKWKG
jgi:hypothetical protein